MLSFDHYHYVPLLQWKSGEQEALRLLAYDDRRRITPLISIPDRRPGRKKGAKVPKRPRLKGEWLSEKVSGLANSWGVNLPAFVELQRVSKSGFAELGMASRIEQFFGEARRKGLRLIPVVRLKSTAHRRAAVQRILAEDRRGVCVRLLRADLDRVNLRDDLAQLLADLQIGVDNTHLVVDLDTIETPYNLLQLCAQIPMLSDWRTFTVAAGSFPSGVAGLELGANWVPRVEWASWREHVNGTLPRIPAFGDYAMLHPVPFNPAIHPNPCANIKYATDSHWVVMKGRQLRDAKPTETSRHDQYPALALLLVEAPETRNLCKSPAFSRGDEYIHKYADKCRQGIGTGRGNTGNPNTWITAGLNHHLTFVVVQIASLAASSNTHAHGGATVQGAQPQQGEQTPFLAVVPPVHVLHLNA